MNEHRYYVGDTYPAINYKVVYEDHQPVDIAGCTFVMKIRDTQPPNTVTLGQGAFELVDGAGGRFLYYPAAQDSQNEGRFELIVQITFPSARTIHMPDPWNMVVQSLA